MKGQTKHAESNETLFVDQLNAIVTLSLRLTEAQCAFVICLADNGWNIVKPTHFLAHRTHPCSMANTCSFNMLQDFCQSVILYSFLVLVGDHNVTQDTGVQYEGGDGVDLESYKCLGNLNQGTSKFWRSNSSEDSMNIDSDPKLWYDPPRVTRLPPWITTALLTGGWDSQLN